MMDCQNCKTPCFTFYEKVNVCPVILNLNTVEERNDFLHFLRYMPDGEDDESSTSDAPEDLCTVPMYGGCCPEFED